MLKNRLLRTSFCFFPGRVPSSAQPRAVPRAVPACWGQTPVCVQDGATSLIVSAQKGLLDVVPLLLDRKADINAGNKVRRSALPPTF